MLIVLFEGFFVFVFLFLFEGEKKGKGCNQYSIIPTIKKRRELTYLYFSLSLSLPLFPVNNPKSSDDDEEEEETPHRASKLFAYCFLFEFVVFGITS